MGGSGCGNWYRWDKKDTTNDYLKLDIRFFTGQYKLEHQILCNRSMKWTRGGNEIASIGYKVDTTNLTKPHIQLIYKNKNESLDYPVRLTSTTPNYGGKRWWFICPAKGCGRRVGVLYGGKIFACRHCYNLTYESQNEAKHYRILHKAQDIHRKLGGTGCTMDYVPKPKGMHWKTFNKLRKKMNYYDNASMMMAAKKFGIIDGF